MLQAVVESLKEEKHDVAILSAAAGDYAAKDREMIKTPSGRESWTIELRGLPKIVEQVKKVDPDIYLVGFKAEYNVSDEELVKRATTRMGEAKMDLIVANDVARKDVGFASDTNEVFIIDAEGTVTHIPITEKEEIARRLLTTISEELGDKPPMNKN